jgi:superfamily I DNA and RNA helicase
MTSGEKRFAYRLEDKLEDDYTCWYEVPVGKRQELNPDFIVLNPRRGLLILEVKDWLLDNIKDVDRESVRLVTPTGLKSERNPLRQARYYAQHIVDKLKRDPALVVQEGAYKGRLKFPWGYGTVLSNITRKQFEGTNLGEVIEPSKVICKDEMTETIAVDAFQARLWEMFHVEFPSTLTMPEIERIRWHLFPEIRVEQHQLSLLDDKAKTTEASTILPDIVRVMDLQQEQLARSLGEGHRIIHGAAGSGKTMLLVYRIQHLAAILQKPILVLCYNVSLATRLKQMISDKRLNQRVSVHNFHAWCREQLQLYHVPFPKDSQDKELYFEQLVQNVIHGAEQGQIPASQYGAVLIDEGHDFRPEWLSLLVKMIDQHSNSLLLLYDDAQSIYGKPGRPKFSFASVGIQARGRTSILRINYRNTAEVLALAYDFAKETIDPHEADDDGIPVVAPESAGRHGMVPIISHRANLQEEINHIVRHFEQYHDAGTLWKEMAIIYRVRFIAEEAERILKAKGIPCEWLQATYQSRQYNSSADSVKIMTMHSSKGLEFPIVAIPGIGHLPYKNCSPSDEARLLYVGMTRAMDKLIMTYHTESVFAKQLISARKRLAA